MAFGHPEAASYPLGRLMDEVNFVNERENSRMLTEVQLLHASIASMLSKESRRSLKELRAVLNVRVVARKDLFTNDSPT
jgi:hypothetical protein